MLAFEMVFSQVIFYTPAGHAGHVFLALRFLRAAMASSNGPRLDACQLVLIVVESVLYGIFLVLFAITLCVLYKRRERNNGHGYKLLLSTACLLFCTITVHWVLDLSRAFDAFIFTQSSSEPSPASQVYEDLATPKYIAISALYILTTIVGDVFMTYRLYIVWDRSPWIIALPACLCVGVLVTGGVTTWLFSKADGSFFETEGAWITSLFVLTCLINLISTSLIGYKVWLTKRILTRVGAVQHTSRVLHTFVQSAALYCICVLLSMALYIRKSNVQWVLATANNPIVGIVFTMIVASTGVVTSSHARSGSEVYSGRTVGADNFALRPVAIRITTEIDGPGEDTTTNPGEDKDGMPTSDDSIDVLDISSRQANQRRMSGPAIV